MEKNKEVVQALKDIEDLKKKAFELRVSLYQGNDKVDTSQFKKIKKNIARLKTKFKL